MIEAKHTWMGKLVFDFYSGYKLEREFRHINFSGDNTDNGLPILLIANHFSWWDAFIPYRLNKHVFKRRFHGMMQEENLRKNMILNGGGVFSIRKNSREVLQSLHYCVDLLKDNNNLVLLFPQGKIESLYTSDFRFQKGISYLLTHTKNECQLFFNVNMVEYNSDKKPSLSIYFKKYILSPPYDIHRIEEAYTRYFNTCKIQQTGR